MSSTTKIVAHDIHRRQFKQCSTWCWVRKTVFYNLVQPRSCENNFGRLRMVQTEVVCGSPVLNIFDFRDSGSCVFASYDQVRVVGKLPHWIKNIDRMQVRRIDGVGSWAESRSLDYAGRYPYYNLPYNPSAPFVRSGFLVSYRIRSAMKFSQNVLHFIWHTYIQGICNPYKVSFEIRTSNLLRIERIKQNGDLLRRRIM